MKVFQRAMKRAEIPISYSEGFNPHPKIVFGLPLSVGVTSEAEYADVELIERLEPDSFLDKLNIELPKGVLILNAEYKDCSNNIMASIEMAQYDVLFETIEDLDIDKMKKITAEFMAMTALTIKKEGKKGVKDVDIRPMIHKINVLAFENANMFCFSVLLSAGNTENLKPELLLKAFTKHMNINFKNIKIHRRELFIK